MGIYGLTLSFLGMPGPPWLCHAASKTARACGIVCCIWCVLWFSGAEDFSEPSCSFAMKLWMRSPSTSTALAEPSSCSLNFATQYFPHPEVADEGLGKRVFTVSSSSLWLNLSQTSKSSALRSSVHAVFTKSCAAACGYLLAGPLLCPDPKEEPARRMPQSPQPSPSLAGHPASCSMYCRVNCSRNLAATGKSLQMPWSCRRRSAAGPLFAKHLRREFRIPIFGSLCATDVKLVTPRTPWLTQLLAQQCDAGAPQTRNGSACASG